MKVSIVIPCKGRLDHLLAYGLPTALSQDHPDKEVILVDFNCPDHCGDAIAREYPEVHVVRADVADDYWSLPHARNLGVLHATGDAVWSLDADNVAPPEYISSNLGRYDLNTCYILPGEYLHGSNMVLRENFLKIRGYNHLMIGYGHDDREFYCRLDRYLGLRRQQSHLPVTQTPHDHELRTKFCAGLSIFDSMRHNERVDGFESIIQPYTGMPPIEKGDFVHDPDFLHWRSQIEYPPEICIEGS